MQDLSEIIVIGGGITGLGVALAASQRGHRAIVLERGDLASATSANSLRIIHGGFRYLQHLDVRRVRESAGEQAYLRSTYPQHFSLLPCVMPLSRWGAKSKYPMMIAAQLFKCIIGEAGNTVPSIQVWTSSEAENAIPALRGLAPHGAFQWHDALLLDHGQFVAALARELEAKGAVIKAKLAAKSVTRAKESGGHWLVETETGEHLASKVVVNAAGPWVKGLLPSDAPQVLREVPGAWCYALNVVMDFSIDPTHAIAIQSSSGRLLFCVPRGQQTALGTWYYPSPAPLPDAPKPSEEELARFLLEARVAFADDRFVRERVSHIDCGVLPRARHKNARPEPLGRHSVHVWEGFAQVVSTKYTTFRSLGREVLSGVEKFL